MEQVIEQQDPDGFDHFDVSMEQDDQTPIGVMVEQVCSICRTPFVWFRFFPGTFAPVCVRCRRATGMLPVL